MVAPLKLNGTAGDLKEITTTEENYLAYLAGLQLAAMPSTDVSALTTASGGTSIGSYSNTFFNEAVGTHDGTNITSGTITTTLYQNTGTASTASADFHKWIYFGGSGNIEEAANNELNEITDRLLSKIFTNDYPGVYKLASTSPGADWDVHLASVFTDTQSLGVTAATYNIYQRQTMTPPTEVKTVKIFNDTTSFDGLKEMNTTEMQVTYGQLAKTRIMGSSNHIGAYQLRSSAQGAPVAAGTWRAVGTATDTKDTISNDSYSGSYGNSFTGSYSRNFTGSYSRAFSGSYTGFYSGAYSRDFAGTYSRNFTGFFTGAYTGFYASSFTGTYSSSFTGSYTGSFAGGYTRNVLQTYITYYNSSFYNNNLNRSASFSRYVPVTYTGFYARSFTGTYSRSFIGSYARAFTGFYSGAYSRDFTGSFIGTYTGSFIGAYTGFYTGFYTNSFTGSYTGSFIGDYANSFTGSYIGETINATDTTIETYTLYVRAA